MKYHQIFFKIVAVIGFSSFVGACGINNAVNMEFPSSNLNEKPSFSVSNVHESWNVEEKGIAPIINLAKDYNENGQGDIMVLVTFEKSDQAKQEKINLTKATDTAKQIDMLFRKYGVTTANVRVAPVEKDKADLAVVSYQAMVISQPIECEKSPFNDVDGTNIRAGLDYKFGCERARMMSQMVAQKKDMLGNTKMESTSSTQLGQTMEEYNAGDTPGEGDLNVVTSALGNN